MFSVCTRRRGACPLAQARSEANRMGCRFVRAIFCFSPLVFLGAPIEQAQTAPRSTVEPRPAVSNSAACDQAPQEDALVSTCAPATQAEPEDIPVVPLPAQPTANIALAIPVGTPIRIALDQRTRVDHAGQFVHGKVVETVYAFDQPVIPAGTLATGTVVNVAGVPGVKRALAYS